jgi:hypothetical protein
LYEFYLLKPPAEALRSLLLLEITFRNPDIAMGGPA